VLITVDCAAWLRRSAAGGRFRHRWGWYVSRTEAVLLALVARMKAGRWRVSGKRAFEPAREPPARRTPVRAPVEIILLRRRGWLVALAPYDAVACTSQMEFPLGGPEMIALPCEVKQARRTLRPLRMISGISREAVREPAVRRPRKAVVAKTPSAEKPRPRGLWDYVASARWPKGVMTAERLERDDVG
jgi:hypothetical protein